MTTVNPADYTQPSAWIPLFMRTPTGSNLQFELLDTWIERYDTLPEEERDHLRLLSLLILRISDFGYERYKKLLVRNPKRMKEQLLDFLENPELIRTVRSKVNVALLSDKDVIEKLTWSSVEEKPAEWAEALKKGAHFSSAWSYTDVWLSVKSTLPEHVWNTGIIKLVKSWAKQDVSKFDDTEKERWLNIGEQLIELDQLDWGTMFMNGQANMYEVYPIVERKRKTDKLLKIMNSEPVSGHAIGQFWNIYNTASNKKELLQKWGIKLSKDQKALYMKIAMLKNKNEIADILEQLKVSPATYIEKTISAQALSYSGYQEFIIAHPDFLSTMLDKTQQTIQSKPVRNTLSHPIIQGFGWINHINSTELRDILHTPKFAVPITTYLQAASFSLRHETWTKSPAIEMLLNLLPENKRKDCVHFFVENFSLSPKTTTDYCNQVVPWYWLNFLCSQQGFDFPSLETIKQLADCFNQPFLQVATNSFEQIIKPRGEKYELSLDP